LPEGALHDLLQRAQAGDPLAEHAIGELYRDGIQVTPDAAGAAMWFRKAAVRGHAPSEYELAWVCEFGLGVPMDRLEAIAWYRRAAVQGHTESKFRLGLILPVDGKPDASDPSPELLEGERWLEAAAEEGHVGAQAVKSIQNGDLGEFVDEKDFDTWWKGTIAGFIQSAQKGDRELAFWLAQFLGDIIPDVDPADPVMGAWAAWIEQEYGRERAQPDYWCRLAADLGHPVAELNLAQHHRAAGDITQAVAWYRRAAEHCQADAMFELGKALLGNSSDSDDAEARTWFERAAKDGHSEAHTFLGWMHLQGRGGVQDYKSALAQYREAARHGEARGWFGAAFMLESGLGADRDLFRAVRLYAEAAHKGDPDGLKAIERLRPTHPLAESFSELLALVGVTDVKATVFKFLDRVHVDQLRRARGLRGTSWSLHSIFSGPPGTGKTTVARILARLLKALGILRQGHLVEVDRAGMVGRYVGETAQKVSSVVEAALGGVLFIDEAYALAQPDAPAEYGQEAIATLVKRMEDHRSDLVVIAAGYESLMDGFLDSNPGLRSRFPWRFRFIDYQPWELLEIFTRFAATDGLLLHPGLGQLRILFKELYDHRDAAFGNGRLVRNLYEGALHAQAARVAQLHAPTNEELQTLTASDVEIAAAAVGASLGRQ
jgi:TPR repeat protein